MSELIAGRISFLWINNAKSLYLQHFSGDKANIKRASMQVSTTPLDFTFWCRFVDYKKQFLIRQCLVKDLNGRSKAHFHRFGQDASWQWVACRNLLEAFRWRLPSFTKLEDLRKAFLHKLLAAYKRITSVA